MNLQLTSLRLPAVLLPLAILPLSGCMAGGLDWQTPLLHPANPDAPTVGFRPAPDALDDAWMRELVERPIVKPTEERHQPDHEHHEH